MQWGEPQIELELKTHSISSALQSLATVKWSRSRSIFKDHMKVLFDLQERMDCTSLDVAAV